MISKSSMGKQPFYDKLAPEITRQDAVYQWLRKYIQTNKSDALPTLTANMRTGGHNVLIILTDSGEIRKLTPEEYFYGQGYPKNFQIPENMVAVTFIT